ncbi:MAG: IS4 family transposase [Thiomicrorhabdus sp.]|nr:IS4 family transposase [Thiomicrorhabdus sp.]
MFSKIFQRFMDKSPVPVMVQVLLERVLSPGKLNSLFERTAVEQYTRTLLFSTLFELMNLVIFKTFPSVNAAYKEEGEQVGVSITSLYNKLNGISIDTSAALVRETAREKREIIEALNGTREPLIPGYRVKMLDGNCIEATEHRLDVLRETKAGALPGKSLVVYDPMLEMAIDVFPCEDGHAQERSLLGQILPTVEKKDVWVMDRNFCVRSFLLGMDDKDGYFICREHKGLKWEASGLEKEVGKTETGTLYEQWITIIDDQGKTRKYRRIRLSLNTETRDGEKEIAILTNLPKTAVSAKLIAENYRKRWCIETLFQELEAHLHSEVNTLGYPKAALFSFCVALVAYNVLAVVKAALRVQHGEETIEKELSGYYLAGNIARTYDGMMIALPEEEWSVFQTLSILKLVEILLQLAANVKLSKFKKSARGPKKPPKKRNKYSKHPHVSTARLLRGIKPND